MSKTIVIAAGGTGGHFFPAEALAYALQQRGYTTILVTDKRSGRREKGPFANAEQHVVRGRGLAGKSVSTMLRNGYELYQGVRETRRILKHVKPNAIVCFGGYPSIPPAVANLNIFGLGRAKLILHEGNAILGKANRFLARRANVIATSFQEISDLPVRRPTVYTGMPVRPEIETLYTRQYDDPRDQIHILVWGGSLGANIFSSIVPKALAALPQEIRHRLHVTQQTREDDIASVRDTYESKGIQATLSPFFDDVAALLKRSHLVIGRAGGSSVAELTISGCPSILVPLPIAVSDEQTANAKKLVEAGAAWLVSQTEFTVDRLQQLVQDLLENTTRLAEASSAAHRMAMPASAERLAELVDAQCRPFTKL